MGNPSKAIADARRALTWATVDGKWDVKACIAANGYQGPYLEAGPAETSGCASLRASHVQVTPLSAPKKWKLRNLDIKDASIEADGFDREVPLRAPLEWGPLARRIRRLRAPASGLNVGRRVSATVAGHIGPGRPEVSSLYVRSVPFLGLSGEVTGVRGP